MSPIEIIERQKGNDVGIDVSGLKVFSCNFVFVHDAIFVKPYVGALDDDELPKLASYLQSVADVPNYRVLEKRNWRSLARHQGT